MNTVSFNPTELLEFVRALPFDLAITKVDSVKGKKKLSCVFDEETAKQIQAIQDSSPETLVHTQGIREFAVIARFAGDKMWEGSDYFADTSHIIIKEVGSKEPMSDNDVLTQLSW